MYNERDFMYSANDWTASGQKTRSLTVEELLETVRRFKVEFGEKAARRPQSDAMNATETVLDAIRRKRAKQETPPATPPKPKTYHAIEGVHVGCRRIEGTAFEGSPWLEIHISQLWPYMPELRRILAAIGELANRYKLGVTIDHNPIDRFEIWRFQ